MWARRLASEDRPGVALRQTSRELGVEEEIDGAGPAGERVTIDVYKADRHEFIPVRGPLAMNTMAGAIGSWQAALQFSAGRGGKLPLSRLLDDACIYAREGMAVTAGQVAATVAKYDEIAHQPGFARRFLPNGGAPTVGSVFRQPAIARVLTCLATDGLDSFYRGALADAIAADFRAVGALLSIGLLVVAKVTFVDKLLGSVINSGVLAPLTGTDLVAVAPWLLLAGAGLAAISGYVTLRLYVRI